jgi:hypothetical protein
VGEEAKLCFAGHALTDNRHGLMTDVVLTPAVATEPEAALAMLTRERRKHLRPKSVGADKGYHTLRFVTASSEQRTAAHVACNAAHTVGLGRGVLESRAYRASQIVRKRIEQFLGWGKTVGGIRKTRLKGVRRNMQLLYLTGAAYNLLRVSRLCPATR